MARDRIAAIVPPVAIALSLVSTSARAQDLSVTGFFSQRFEADDNPGLSSGDGGTSIGAITDLGLILSAATPRLQIRFAPGLRGAVYSGRDRENSVTPRLNSSLSYAMSRDTLSASLSVVPRQVSDARFEDGGGLGRDENVDAVQISIDGRLGWVHRLDPRNSLSLGWFASADEYTTESDSLSPRRSYGADASWTRDLDARTSASLNTALTWFESDDEDDPGSRAARVTGGLSRALTPRWSASGDLGVSFVDEDGPDAGNTVTAVGGLDLSYAGPATTLGFSLSSGVDQNADGALENSLTLGADLSRQITSRSSLSLGARARLGVPLEGEDESRVLSLTPSFSHALTRDWSVSVGYTLRLEDDDEGSAVSNIGFLQLSRNLSLLP
jgi:hypothetical protein